MATMGFFIAVGIVSAVLFAFMTRADRARDRRRAYADGATGDTAISSGNDGFSMFNWWIGRSSSSSSEESCNPSSPSLFGSSDGSCSSDGGGGGDGGGGSDS